MGHPRRLQPVPLRCRICERECDSLTRSGRCPRCRYARRSSGGLVDNHTPWEEDDRCWYVVAHHPNGITLDDCASLMNISRERVRQIEAEALGKLRDAHPELLAYLSGLEPGHSLPDLGEVA